MPNDIDFSSDRAGGASNDADRLLHRAEIKKRYLLARKKLDFALNISITIAGAGFAVSMAILAMVAFKIVT